jgi:ribosomal protein S18 acetylase RimI-like enzyme
MAAEGVKIRFATLEDLPDIRQMWTTMIAEIAPTYPGDMASGETADEFTRQAARVLADPEPETFCLLATAPDGTPVGFHFFGYQSRDLGTPHRIVFVYWIYVLPAYRRSPLAEDLAMIAAEHGLTHGVSIAEMSRYPGQAYRKGLGFEPFEIRSRAPLTTILTRLEERRRRRHERQARSGNGLDPDMKPIPPPPPQASAESPDDEEPLVP